tara:strand:- start:306 stop:443 length:138 start_codon:yes stop_codon:yes gene_type:complete
MTWWCDICEKPIDREEEVTWGEDNVVRCLKCEDARTNPEQTTGEA